MYFFRKNSTTHVCEFSVLTWTAQCLLRRHAAAVRLQADLSSFLMWWEQQQLPHLFAGWLENLICLSESTWEREGDYQDGGREGKKDRRNEGEVLLSEHWRYTFLFRCDTMTHANTLSIFSVLFSSFSQSLTSQPHFSSILGRASYFPKYWLPRIEHVCMLPPCGSDITTLCSAFLEW